MNAVRIPAWTSSLAALLMTVAAPVAAQQPPIAIVAQGALRGTARDGIVTYRGIPYAQPPVGPLRWQPPRPALPWQGTRDAARFGPACPQAHAGDPAIVRALGALPGDTSEDCLTLNIWAPARHDRPLPVMLWIHGGAHRFGAGSLPYYDGTAFARDGVILVTINYRLGLLGYFAHPALTAEAGADAPLGNYGAMDQLAALQWVHDNIAALGGDPANVTLFGESAGGVSTLTLMTLPQAKGLFQKAIVESGGGWQREQNLTRAEQDGIDAARQAGLGDQATADQLRALPADALLDVKGGPGFGPFVDGRFIREGIAASFAEGKAAAVPLIIGYNSDEGSLMEAFALKPETMLTAIPPVAQDYLRNLYDGRADSDAALARRLFADGGFSAPARWIARMQSAKAPAFLYRFDYVTDARRTALKGTPHGGEIPYVFDTLSTIPTLASVLTPADIAQARTVHECWVAFAKSGVPTCAGAPQWPGYDDQKDAAMNFSVPNSVTSGFDAQIYDLLEKSVLKSALRTPVN